MRRPATAVLATAALLVAGCRSDLRIDVAVDDAAGLAAGDPVRYRGLQIGTVESVGLEGGRPVIHARIDEAHRDQLRVGAQLVASGPGLLSDAPRALVVEDLGKGPPLKDRARIEGAGAGEVLGRKAKQVLEGLKTDLGEALDDLGKGAGEAAERAAEAVREAEQAGQAAGEEAKRLGEEATRLGEDALRVAEQAAQAAERYAESGAEVLEQAREKGEEAAAEAKRVMGEARRLSDEARKATEEATKVGSEALDKLEKDTLPALRRQLEALEKGLKELNE